MSATLSLALDLSPAHLAALDAASAPAEASLYALFGPAMRRNVVFGGASVRGWAA